jgi:hypothetical protein
LKVLCPLTSKTARHVEDETLTFSNAAKIFREADCQAEFVEMLQIMIYKLFALKNNRPSFTSIINLILEFADSLGIIPAANFISIIQNRRPS